MNNVPNSADYSDLISLSRPQHAKSPMSRSARAAQFAPYAALVGYQDIISEHESIASAKVDLDRDVSLIPDAEYLESTFLESTRPDNDQSFFNP